MTFDAEGCIPRDMQLDDSELSMPPPYDDHILDQPLADYDVLNSEEAEGILDDIDGGHILGSVDSDLPSYTATPVDNPLQTPPAP